LDGPIPVKPVAKGFIKCKDWANSICFYFFLCYLAGIIGKTDKNSKAFQKNGLPAIFLKCPTNVEEKYAI
jgi:hypothetical protein